MIQAIDIVSSFDHLNLFQFFQSRGNGHIVLLMFLFLHFVVKTGIQAVSDDHGNKLNEELRLGGLR